jgi:hypothetical protein
MCRCCGPDFIDTAFPTDIEIYFDADRTAAPPPSQLGMLTCLNCGLNSFCRWTSRRSCRSFGELRRNRVCSRPRTCLVTELPGPSCRNARIAEGSAACAGLAAPLRSGSRRETGVRTCGMSHPQFSSRALEYHYATRSCF